MCIIWWWAQFSLFNNWHNDGPFLPNGSFAGINMSSYIVNGIRRWAIIFWTAAIEFQLFSGLIVNFVSIDSPSDGLVRRISLKWSLDTTTPSFFDAISRMIRSSYVPFGVRTSFFSFKRRCIDLWSDVLYRYFLYALMND